MKFRDFLNESNEMAFATLDAVDDILAKEMMDMLLDMFEDQITSGEIPESEYVEKFQGVISIINGEKGLDNTSKRKCISKIKALAKKYNVPVR